MKQVVCFLFLFLVTSTIQLDVSDRAITEQDDLIIQSMNTLRQLIRLNDTVIMDRLETLLSLLSSNDTDPLAHSSGNTDSTVLSNKTDELKGMNVTQPEREMQIQDYVLIISDVPIDVIIGVCVIYSLACLIWVSVYQKESEYLDEPQHDTQCITTDDIETPKEEVRGNLVCCVCLDRLPNIALSCGHCYCANCEKKLEKRCPLCREISNKTIKLYVH